VFSDITTRHGGSGSSELYHGGAVVLQRNATEPCCRDWCALINLPASEDAPITAATMDDQFALGNASAVYRHSLSSSNSSSSSYSRGCAVHVLQDRHMKFMVDWWSLVWRKPAALSHFTHTARSHLKARSIKGAVHRWLALSERNVGPQCLAQARTAYGL
jgi:hypothetical protein